jgi:hypothetical protein
MELILMENASNLKTEMVSFSVEKDVKQAIDDSAWKQRISVSEYIRNLIYKDLGLPQAN